VKSEIGDESICIYYIVTDRGVITEKDMGDNPSLAMVTHL